MILNDLISQIFPQYYHDIELQEKKLENKEEEEEEEFKTNNNNNDEGNVNYSRILSQSAFKFLSRISNHYIILLLKKN